MAKKKKTIDTWKTKEWYSLVAPVAFNEKEFGETPSSAPEKLKGRTCKPTLREITGNLKKSHINLTLRIKDIKGKKAYTELAGHEIQRDYVRRLIRRRMNVVRLVSDQLQRSL